MGALKSEYEREPSPVRCRLVGEIAGPICKSQEEFEQVMEFIGPRRLDLIQSWRRGVGLAVQPNKAGLDWIESQRTPFTLQRLYWIIGIAGVIFTIGWGVFVWLSK
jgi:hypothetical protein